MATETKTITPTELAKELDVDAKRVRSYLRANHARSAEDKNTSWMLSADVVKATRAHFTKKPAPAKDAS